MADKYVWFSAARFRVQGEEVWIEGLVSDAEITGLFPEFYYLTQEGATLEEIQCHFPAVASERMEEIVWEFLQRGFLTTSVEEINKVFYPQGRNLGQQHDLSLYTEEHLEQFQQKALQRCIYTSKESIVLEEIETDPLFLHRVSTRDFSERNLSLEELSELLQIAGRRVSPHCSERYYPSAGGLAPVDLYVYVAENRVAGVSGGLYYYAPHTHALHRIRSGACIKGNVHNPMNRGIFEQACVNLYFVYNADVNMPKYGTWGYFYGIVDSGILAGFLTMQAEKMGLGSCIIGDQEFDRIQDCFALRPNQIFLFTMSVGAKK